MVITGKLRSFVGSGGKFAAWIILIVASAAFLDLSAKGLIVGFFLILVSLFVITAKDVLQVDTSSRKYRIASSYYGFYSGEWMALPEIEKISVVVSTSVEGASDGYNNSMAASKQVYAVRLHQGPGRKIIVVGRYPLKTKADEVARLLSEELKVSVAG